MNKVLCNTALIATNAFDLHTEPLEWRELHDIIRSH